jgi:hypothetical protein
MNVQAVLQYVNYLYGTGSNCVCDGLGISIVELPESYLMCVTFLEFQVM